MSQCSDYGSRTLELRYGLTSATTITAVVEKQTDMERDFPNGILCCIKCEIQMDIVYAQHS